MSFNAPAQLAIVAAAVAYIAVVATAVASTREYVILVRAASFVRASHRNASYTLWFSVAWNTESSFTASSIDFVKLDLFSTE